MSTKRDVNDILLDLTGEEYDTIETVLGGPIEESSGFKLTKALGFVRHRAATEQPELTFATYNKRTMRQITQDAGLDDEVAEVPNVG